MNTQDQTVKDNGGSNKPDGSVDIAGGRSTDKAAAKAVLNKSSGRSGSKKAPEKPKRKRVSPAEYVRKGRQFLKESKMELKKVKWPTRKELLAATTVVLVLVMIVSFFLGLVDFGLIKMIKGVVG